MKLVLFPALFLSLTVHAQSGKSSRVTRPEPKPIEKVAKPLPVVEEKTGVITLNRNLVASLLEIEGDKIKINLKRLRAMQSRPSGSLKGLCPEGQEFKDVDVDFKASNATVADAHLTAFSAVIGTRWSVVTLPEFGKDFNKQYIKLSRNIDEIRSLKQQSSVDEARLKQALTEQQEIVQQVHQSSEPQFRVLIEKMKNAEPPKKLATLKLPLPLRYSCQPKSLSSTVDAGAPETDAVQ